MLFYIIFYLCVEHDTQTCCKLQRLSVTQCCALLFDLGAKLQSRARTVGLGLPVTG